MKTELTHLDEHGHINMVDVTEKQITQRIAIAEAKVVFPVEVYQIIQQQNGQTKKGNIAEIARIAGIMAAKKTSELIPLCHPLMLENCKINIVYHDETSSIDITAEVSVAHKTGVEMEALTAVSIAALTIYDMTKALSHRIQIEQIQLKKKSGGKHDFDQ